MALVDAAAPHDINGGPVGMAEVFASAPFDANGGKEMMASGTKNFPPAEPAAAGVPAAVASPAPVRKKKGRRRRRTRRHIVIVDDGSTSTPYQGGNCVSFVVSVGKSVGGGGGGGGGGGADARQCAAALPTDGCPQPAAPMATAAGGENGTACSGSIPICERVKGGGGGGGADGRKAVAPPPPPPPSATSWLSAAAAELDALAGMAADMLALGDSHHEHHHHQQWINGRGGGGGKVGGIATDGAAPLTAVAPLTDQGVPRESLDLQLGVRNGPTVGGAGSADEREVDGDATGELRSSASGTAMARSADGQGQHVLAAASATARARVSPIGGGAQCAPHVARSTAAEKEEGRRERLMATAAAARARGSPVGGVGARCDADDLRGRCEDPARIAVAAATACDPRVGSESSPSSVVCGAVDLQAQPPAAATTAAAATAQPPPQPAHILPASSGFDDVPKTRRFEPEDGEMERPFSDEDDSAPPMARLRRRGSPHSPSTAGTTASKLGAVEAHVNDGGAGLASAEDVLNDQRRRWRARQRMLKREGSDRRGTMWGAGRLEPSLSGKALDCDHASTSPTSSGGASSLLQSLAVAASASPTDVLRGMMSPSCRVNLRTSVIGHNDDGGGGGETRGEGAEYDGKLARDVSPASVELPSPRRDGDCSSPDSGFGRSFDSSRGGGDDEEFAECNNDFDNYTFDSDDPRSYSSASASSSWSEGEDSGNGLSRFPRGTERGRSRHVHDVNEYTNAEARRKEETITREKRQPEREREREQEEGRYAMVGGRKNRREREGEDLGGSDCVQLSPHDQSEDDDSTVSEKHSPLEKIPEGEQETANSDADADTSVDVGSQRSGSSKQLSTAGVVDIKKFVKQITTDGIPLIWYKVHGSEMQIQPTEIMAFVELEDAGIDSHSVYSEPCLIWCVSEFSPGGSGGGEMDDSREEVRGSIGLFDIRSVERADAASPISSENGVFVILNSGGVILFEAENNVEQKRMINGLRHMVARLAFNLVIGNVGICSELLSYGEEEESGIEEMEVFQAMNDVTNHLVDKSVQKSLESSQQC